VLDIYYSTLKIVTQAYTFLLEFEGGGGVGYYYPTLEIVGVDNEFIRQSSSLKVSFEIELGPLDFNMVSEPPLGCWADLPPNYDPRVWLIRHT
jgi:hypothetical protein